MKNIYKVFAILLFTATTLSVSAQERMIMMTGDTPQAYNLNPGVAVSSSYLIVPFLGSFGVGVSNPFGYGDIMTGKYIDGEKVMSRVKNNNPMNITGNFDLINFGVKFRDDNLISGAIRVRAAGGINYPKDVFRFIFDNPLSQNTMFDVPLNADVLTWAEVAIGYNRVINDNWSVGGRVKYIMGGMSIQTGNTELFVDKKVSSYIVSGDVDIKYGNFDANNNKIGTNFFSSPGVGVDLGAEYKSYDGWRASLAVTDIGFIKWDGKSSSRVVSPNEHKEFKFSGMGDLSAVFATKTMSALLDSTYKALLRDMDLDTTNTSFTSMLPMNINAYGEYDIRRDKMHLISLGFQGQTNFKKRFNYGLTAGYKYTIPNGKFSALASYTFSNIDPAIIGVGIMAGSDTFKFLLMGDINATGFAGARNLKTFSLRMGMNIKLGRYRHDYY